MVCELIVKCEHMKVSSWQTADTDTMRANKQSGGCEEETLSRKGGGEAEMVEEGRGLNLWENV